MQKKLYVVLSVPFLMLFWKEKEKKEEARLGLYHRYLPPVLFCSSPVRFWLGYCYVTSTTLLHSLFSLSLSRSYIGLSKNMYISMARYNKDPTITPLFTLPNRP